MKRYLTKIIIFVLFLLLQNCNSISFQNKSTEKSIWEKLNKNSIVDVKEYNSKIYITTNSEIIRCSFQNDTLMIEEKGFYRQQRISTDRDFDKIAIKNIDEKLIVIQVDDVQNHKDTLYFIDRETCQKISERELLNNDRIVFIKTNPYDLETSDAYYLLSKPNNTGISLEKVSYKNQQTFWTYTSRYSGWDIDGVLFVDKDYLLLSDLYFDYKHYQINLINTIDGSIKTQKLINKSYYSNLRLSQVTDHTFFIFDFTDIGVTTSLWELKPDDTLQEKWTKALEGVKRENISGFSNKSPYIYFIHRDEPGQGGTLWYLDLLKATSVHIKMMEIPPEIERSSPELATTIGNYVFLSFVQLPLKPKPMLLLQTIFLINQADGTIVWKKSNASTTFYDGRKRLIFDSKKTQLFLNENICAFIWNDDKVEIINLLDGKSINLISREGLYKKFNYSFFIQEKKNLIWLRDNGSYEIVKMK